MGANIAISLVCVVFVRVVCFLSLSFEFVVVFEDRTNIFVLGLIWGSQNDDISSAPSYHLMSRPLAAATDHGRPVAEGARLADGALGGVADPGARPAFPCPVV